VTNASGGINPKFNPGDLILITDHINLFFQNPLVELIENNWTRYPGNEELYDSNLGCLAEDSALQLGFRLKKGVLLGNPGPSYETKAEIQMVRKMGADCVSMSMVPEVIIARQMGLRVLGISCITNLATGITQEQLSHREVTEVANTSKDQFAKLLSAIIHKIPNEVKN
jgi:purine-nucleoside phosphorylase